LGLSSLQSITGIDLTLVAFVGLRIQFGLATEEIQLSAVTVGYFISPMYHVTDTFNETALEISVSLQGIHLALNVDVGLFFKPQANLFFEATLCVKRGLNFD